MLLSLVLILLLDGLGELKGLDFDTRLILIGEGSLEMMAWRGEGGVARDESEGTGSLESMARINLKQVSK